MADIMIKMGVNSPEEDVDTVLAFLEYIYQQDGINDHETLRVEVFEESFSDGALGVLTSMSIIVNYEGTDGTQNTFHKHILESFQRRMVDGKESYALVVSSIGRKLVSMVFKQRELEHDEEKRNAYILEQSILLFH